MVAIVEAFERTHAGLTAELRSIVEGVSAAGMRGRIEPLCHAIRSAGVVSHDSVYITDKQEGPPELRRPTNSLEESLRLVEALERAENERILQQDSQEAARIAAEIEEKDRLAKEMQSAEDAEAASRIASEMEEREEAERRAREMFQCSLCLIEEPVHGSYELECGHRICEDMSSGYIRNKINSHEVRKCYRLLYYKE